VPVARDGSGRSFWGVRNPVTVAGGDPTEKEQAMSSRKRPTPGTSLRTPRREGRVMASVWIRTRKTKDGTTRHLVEFRGGGRESMTRHAGSFPKRLATIRAAWVEGELAAMRVPQVGAHLIPLKHADSA